MKMLRLKDIGEIYDGPHATPKRIDSGDLHFLNISGLQNGRLELSTADRITPSDFETWTRRVQPEQDDLLFSYETRIGEAALMPVGISAALGRRMALLRPDKNVADPRFLLYFWLSPGWQAFLQQRTLYGATVNRIPIGEMPNWPIALPPLAEQVKVSGVLGSIDDKIVANSHVASAALEIQSAVWQAGTKNAELIPLVEVAEPILGGTPPRKDEASWNGDYKWASVADMTASPRSHLMNTAETISDAAANKKRFSPLPAGSVLLSARGTVGRVVSMVGPTSFNQSAYGFEAKPGFDAALRLAVMSAVKELRAKSYGSVFSTITKTQIQEALVPSVFSDRTQPLHQKLNTLEDLIVALEKENLTLTKTRDELLPLLMSGKITVKEAEQEATSAGADIPGEENTA